MKLVFVIFVTLFISVGAQARQLGSQCGLVDSFGDESVVSLPGYLSLSRWSDRRIEQLPTLTKQQLIISAKYFTKYAEAEYPIISAVRAADYLRAQSEAGDFAIAHYEILGSEYTEVVYYPGGNPYSVIFISNSSRIVAYNEDDTIYCK